MIIIFKLFSKYLLALSLIIFCYVYLIFKHLKRLAFQINTKLYFKIKLELFIFHSSVNCNWINVVLKTLNFFNLIIRDNVKLKSFSSLFELFKINIKNYNILLK